MNKLLKSSKFRLWLAIVGTATILLITAYTMVQQETRLQADDAPLAIAQIAKHQLESGADPSKVIPIVKTDLASDNTVFVTVASNSEKLLASSAVLDGGATLPPTGTFDYTRSHGSDHFTWQPRAGVRLATSMLKYDNGFVVTGQSLGQFERRVNEYTIMMVVAWLAVLAWTSAVILVPTKRLGS